MNEDLNYGVKIETENKLEETPDTNRQITKPSKQKQSKQQHNTQVSLSNALHPMACIFTFIFKVTSFFVYFVIGSFFSEVNTFIIVVMLSAFDFWTVKNVTGRLLVGLRWWSDFDENGKQVWRFESYDQQFSPNSVDSTFFWISQLAGTLVWAVFLVMKILSFSVFWSLLVFINFVLCGINLYGFYKCKGQHNKKMSEMKKNFAQKGVKTFFNNFMK